MINLTIIISLMTMGQDSPYSVPCVTWDNLNGACVPIVQCPSLHSTNGLVPLQFQDNSTCSHGAHSKNNLVCCPAIVSTTTTKEKIETPCITRNHLNGTCAEIEDCPWIDPSSVINIRLDNDEDDEFACNGNRDLICCPPMETATANVPEDVLEAVEDVKPVKSTPCVTSRNISGTILEINQCPSLYSSRLRVENATDIADQTTFLNHFTVGFNPKTQKRIVCCPTIDTLALTEVEVDTLETLRTSNSFPKLDQCGISNANSYYKRVVGGFPVSRGQFPWIVMIGYTNATNPKFKCGGSLISKNYVLTAGHCLVLDTPVILEIGKIGRYEKPEYIGKIEQWRVHEDYGLQRGSHDIGLIKVTWLNPNRQPVDFKPSDISNYICMPHPELEPNITNSYVGYHPYVAGWGRIAESGPMSDELRATQVVVVATQNCDNEYRKIRLNHIDTKKICANWEGHDACTGDSGGPLMLAQMYNGQLHYYQIGVVSHGYGCARRKFPGVYMRITSYLPWIHKTMLELEAENKP